jgi:prepilin-type N-terminal cleavage/methylation domain-containing protein
MSNGTSIHLDEEHGIGWLEFCLHLATLEEEKSDTHKKSCQDSNSDDDSDERFSTILTKHRDDIWSIIKYSYTLEKPKRNMQIFSNHRGMTLVELIIGIAITGMVVAALLYFLVGSANQVARLQWQNSTVSWLSELSDTIASIRRSYSSWEIIYENGQNKGYDVILFSRRENSWVLNGVLMGVVTQSGSTLSYLDQPSGYSIYGEKKFGFLKMGDTAINSILSVTGSLREDVLFGSGMTPGIDMSDALLINNLLPLSFDTKSYNSGAITEAIDWNYTTIFSWSFWRGYR